MRTNPGILVSISGLCENMFTVRYIDLWELGRMMEKLGKHKNQLELKKMIQEVDSTNTG